VKIKHSLSIALTGLITFLWVNSAWAAEALDLQYQDPAKTTTSAASTNWAALLLRVGLSLAVIIGLALLLVKLLQKNSLLSRKSSWAQVLDQIAIGQNKSLALVKIFGKVYVLAVTDHSISKLLDEQEIDLDKVDQVTENSGGAISPVIGGKFAALLESKLADIWKRKTGE
jgi:flagellar biosynthetic protein FliO